MKEKAKKVFEWATRHWIFIVIAAAASYIGVIIFRAARDKGLGPDGKPYYADFSSAEEKEEQKDETE